MEAIDRGVCAQHSIIDTMNSTLEKPRPARKDNGPVLENLDVPSNKQTILFGNGGVNMKRITADTGQYTFP